MLHSYIIGIITCFIATLFHWLVNTEHTIHSLAPHTPHHLIHSQPGWSGRVTGRQSCSVRHCTCFSVARFWHSIPLYQLRAHRFPEYLMMRLIRYDMRLLIPDGSASKALDYAGLLWNLFSLGCRDRDAGPKRCHYFQTSCAQSHFNPFYTCCNMLLTRLHHSPVVTIPLLLPSNYSMLPLHRPLFFPLLRTREVGAIIIIIQDNTFRKRASVWHMRQ